MHITPTSAFPRRRAHLRAQPSSPRPKLFQKQSRIRCAPIVQRRGDARATAGWLHRQSGPRVRRGAHQGTFPRRCARRASIRLWRTKLHLFNLLELRSFLGQAFAESFFQLSVRPGEVLPRRASIASSPSGIDSSRFIGRRISRETRKAGTWPPPLVTLARPVALRRVRKPQSFHGTSTGRNPPACRGNRPCRRPRCKERPRGGWNAFLDDPHAVLRGKRTFDRRSPGGFTGFPAERHTGAAILIAGLRTRFRVLYG